jgi:Amt family ammonium transporter
MKAATLGFILCAVIALGAPVRGFAQAAAAAPTPTVEQRLSAVEAYIANSDPRAGVPVNTIGVPGPGHNGFIMVAAALILFMTLPGLALSYAGLVRRKNVLSVLAQTFGIAGVATILWWAVGYSLVFAPGKPWIGGLQ